MNIFKCVECDALLYEGDAYYDIDDVCFCEDCGRDWLDQFKSTVPVDRGDRIPLKMGGVRQ